jgi:Pyridoxamine 5'-phosphate oxidase
MLQIVNERDYDGGLGLAQAPDGAELLNVAASMRLLASVDYGRVVFTLNALPAVRVVNHLVDGDRIIIRTRLTAAISDAVRSADGVVIAYEADRIDPATRTGWSVVATGLARTMIDPDQITRYEQLLHPWVNHADTVVAITPAMITGLRLHATGG